MGQAKSNFKCRNVGVLGHSNEDYERCSEETQVVFVDDVALAEAQAFLTGCERCVPYTELTFDYILDAVTECNPIVTEYVLCAPVKCPRCGNNVTPKTFVEA